MADDLNSLLSNSGLGFFSSSSNAPSTDTSTDSGMSGNSLVAALAGDATKVFAAYETADVAKHTIKANPASANTLILVAGGVAALFIVLLLLRK